MDSIVTLEPGAKILAAESPSTKLETPILITGASGFLGKALIAQANARGYDVRCVARSPLPSVKSTQQLQMDLVANDIPQSFIDGCNQVLHVAGLAHQFGSHGENADRFTEVNVTAARKAALAAAKAGVKHFVLISSVAVYGESDGKTVRNEDSPCKPSTFYAISKYHGELAVAEVCKKAGMKLTILRMTTLYGEGDRGNTQRLIRGVDRGTFPFLGDGQNRKSLLHVDDAARACWTVLERWGTEQEATNETRVFNVAGDPATMLDIYQQIRSSLGKPQFFVRIPLGVIRKSIKPIGLLPKIGKAIKRIDGALEKWSRDDVYDGSKLAKLYECYPQVSLGMGLRRQVQHYAIHQRSTRLADLLKRCADICGALVLLTLFAIPMMAVALAVKLTSNGPAIYVSNRVGKNKRIFRMPKFRTMRTDTPQVATHLLGSANSYLTPIGNILRKTSLDELPQLLSVLKGDMSFVGPRPALFNQDDLIALRETAGVTSLRPGITGWAQINGRDELALSEKVAFDQQYLLRRSLWFDLRIMVATAAKVFLREGVRSADEKDGIAGWLAFAPIENDSAIILTSPDVALEVCNQVTICVPAERKPVVVSVRHPDGVKDLLTKFSAVRANVKLIVADEIVINAIAEACNQYDAQPIQLCAIPKVCADDVASRIQHALVSV